MKSTTAEPERSRRTRHRRFAAVAARQRVALRVGGPTHYRGGTTGEPIKVMTVTTLNAAGPTYQNIANTAMAYEEYINANGGIAGRPLEVTVCDEQFDPAVATTCARDAVENGMVSVVGSFTFFAESIVPVLAESEDHVVRRVLPDHAVGADEPVLVPDRQPADVRRRRRVPSRDRTGARRSAP